MAIEPAIFWVFSTILVLSAGAVVTVRNPVHAVIFLVLAFVTSAALWLLLEAEFLALALVLVYVGAVMVLFLFVVMMLDINIAPLREGFVRNLWIGIPVLFVVIYELWVVVGTRHFGLDKVAAPVRHAADYSNTKELGSILYTVYVYPFELAAVILLVAIVAAIALTLRRRPQTKYQDPGEQALVRRNDRIRVVKMAAEQKQSRERVST